MPKPKSATPALDKLVSVHDQSQVCGEFMEWLLTKKKFVLCKRHVHCEECYTMGLTKTEFRAKYEDKTLGKDSVFRSRFFGIASAKELARGRFNAPQCGASNAYVFANVNIETLLHQFFQIDPNKVERERRALLEQLRKQNAA